MEMNQIDEDQNYLDEILIEAEHEAEKQAQILRKEDEARAVEERKATRLQKAAEKYEKEEIAREQRRRRMEGSQTHIRDAIVNNAVEVFDSFDVGYWTLGWADFRIG
ncbi:uncharacterized protein MELLADRAFT_62353 [Melampsora larici-populina 98AG31]|uniref:Uncharacterized protein n=1 Tax=Melampsora larici-populina (strain 98AG31 / pathotype 3-4-7) TaxID=747676 RepID=F4RIN6_MELLP|nr:uncharacterized protein MELLADRAFT_62353 [Melampsora larici-populina 98AG31]EGG07802.1 hypothetical protein MELLADRAFT_62353 [Melampsora larici-populina 98AG31]